MNDNNYKRLESKNIMEIVFCFDKGGSEKLASTIALSLKNKDYNISVCATHSGFGDISDELKKHNIPCYAIDSPKKSKIKGLYELYTCIKRENVEILHVHHIPMLRYSYIPAKLAGVRKIILTEHTDYEVRKYKKNNRVARRYCNKADKVTVLHDSMYEYFKNDLKFKKHKLSVIRNGVDLDKFKPLKKDINLMRAINCENAVIIGWVGRMHEDKDLINLVQAIEFIKNSDLSIPFVVILVGDRPEREKIEDIVNSKILNNYFRFLGERDDIPYLMSNFDLFVLPSKTEGVPLVLLEALACAIPCIATDVGGVSEIVNESTGILVPKESPKEFSSAIVGLIDSPSKRQALGRQGREFVLKNYALKNMLQEYESLMVV